MRKYRHIPAKTPETAVAMTGVYEKQLQFFKILCVFINVTIKSQVTWNLGLILARKRNMSPSLAIA